MGLLVKMLRFLALRGLNVDGKQIVKPLKSPLSIT